MIVTKIEVLWFEKKMYHCLAKMTNSDTFAIRHKTKHVKFV